MMKIFSKISKILQNSDILNLWNSIYKKKIIRAVTSGL